MCVENPSTKFCDEREKGGVFPSLRCVDFCVGRCVSSLVCAFLFALTLSVVVRAQGHAQAQEPLQEPLQGPLQSPLQDQREGKENSDSEADDASLHQRVDSLQSQIERLSKDVGVLGKMGEQDSATLPQSAAWLSFVAELQERMRVMERTLTDLTGRVEQLERYGGGKQGSNTRVEENTANGRSADEQFSAAQNLLRTRRLGDAVSAFGNFAKNYPNDPRVAESLFYLGESYAVLQDDKAAMKAFLDGYKNDRDSSFAPRLLLRLGQTLAKLERGEQACRVLREFQKRFGDKDTDMTKLAESELVANNCNGS